LATLQIVGQQDPNLQTWDAPKEAGWSDEAHRLETVDRTLTHSNPIQSILEFFPVPSRLERMYLIDK
jgi:hypothetical protein